MSRYFCVLTKYLYTVASPSTFITPEFCAKPPEHQKQKCRQLNQGRRSDDQDFYANCGVPGTRYLRLCRVPIPQTVQSGEFRAMGKMRTWSMTCGTIPS